MNKVFRIGGQPVSLGALGRYSIKPPDGVAGQGLVEMVCLSHGEAYEFEVPVMQARLRAAGGS